MLVQVTGQRNWDDFKAMDRALRAVHPQTIVHGNARGADSLARDWAVDNLIREVSFPAQWDLHGKKAGIIRNQEMLDYTLAMRAGYLDGALVLAFLDEARYGESKGTAHMIRICREAGLEVRVINTTPPTTPRTTIHNLKTEPIQKGDVYIGRASSSPGSCLGHTGYFGNPFPTSQYPLGESLRLYEEYLAQKLEDPEFVSRLKMIKGKRLFCFCKPQPCHGDLLIKAIESL